MQLLDWLKEEKNQLKDKSAEIPGGWMCDKCRQQYKETISKAQLFQSYDDDSIYVASSCVSL